MKNMNILEFNARTMKIKKRLRIPYENHENHENHKISNENYKNHKHMLNFIRELTKK